MPQARRHRRALTAPICLRQHTRNQIASPINQIASPQIIGGVREDVCGAGRALHEAGGPGRRGASSCGEKQDRRGGSRGACPNAVPRCSRGRRQGKCEPPRPERHAREHVPRTI
ncbi:hypothetical protein T484DRAFT_1964439 [Baffinella frigidus]|nr:hypothetical protein T484DRAFT_1964439 [Cryptophyta sp. CCMP2293]